MLNCFEQFDQFEPFEPKNKKDEIALNGLLQKYSKVTLKKQRLGVLKAIVQYLKDNDLLSTTIIKSMGFSYYEYGQYNHSKRYKLLSFPNDRTKPINALSLDENNSKMYSIPIPKYKAWIHSIKVLLSHNEFKSIANNDYNIITGYIRNGFDISSMMPYPLLVASNNKNSPPLAVMPKIIHLPTTLEQEDETLIKLNTYLKKIGRFNVSAKVDDANRYYFESKVPQKPIKEVTGIRFTFSPVFDSKSNYFKMSFKSARNYNLKATTKRWISVQALSKTTYEFNINNFTTTKKSILQKYNSSKKHHFKLSDDKSDLKSLIDAFSQNRRFVLIHNEKQFLECLKGVKTVKQFDKIKKQFVSNEISVSVKVNEFFDWLLD